MEDYLQRYLEMRRFHLPLRGRGAEKLRLPVRGRGAEKLRLPVRRHGAERFRLPMRRCGAEGSICLGMLCEVAGQEDYGLG